ncbi:MAG: extracellular solute-binding protein [Halanaeroarchaeum sp.]
MTTTHRTRRSVLAAAGSLGAAALAGCTASGARAQTSVLSAGSLAVVFTETVGPAFEAATPYGFRGEYYGSGAVMRMVTSGQQSPDVVVSADARLLRDALERRPNPLATWDVVFASNEIGITYAPGTELGRRLASEGGEPWYEALRDADAEIARTDPDLDPLGYRTVMLFELAERYYDEPGLAADLGGNLVVDPSEAHLLAAVETGDRAAAVSYKNMAVDHDLPFLSLPARLNFSSPRYAEYYATATYTMESGTTVRGRPILYNATVPVDAPEETAGERFLSFLLRHPDVLEHNGLTVPAGFPRPHGDVPAEVMP